MLQHYVTIKTNEQHETTIQKSRFITHVQRVSTEQEAKIFIQKIKKQHYQANHNCSAYLIGERDQYQKANDDGEPSGTAGVPMLDVLKKRQLKNVAVVVTRYFGGIKLGAGGLVRAYSHSVSDALRAIGLVECELMTLLSCTVSYPLQPIIEHALSKRQLVIKNVTYSEFVTFTIFVKQPDIADISTWLTDLTNGSAQFSIGENSYIERPLP